MSLSRAVCSARALSLRRIGGAGASSAAPHAARGLSTTTFKLPDLTYDYAELEPVVSVCVCVWKEGGGKEKGGREGGSVNPGDAKDFLSESH